MKPGLFKLLELDPRDWKVLVSPEDPGFPIHVPSDVVSFVPHYLRKTSATLMQKLKVSREVINLCQNHVIGSKVHRVCLLDDYADEKREAWNKLGDKLEAILSATNVVSVQKSA